MTSPTPVLLLGCGTVGRAVIEQVAARPRELAIFGIADRSGLLVEPDLEIVRTLKAQGGALATLGAGSWCWPDRPAIVIDASVGDQRALWDRALDRGHAVVTANKAPLAAINTPWTRWRPAWRRGRLQVGGTVGAGVPSASLLRELVAGGDRIERIEGVVSGTLHFVVESVTRGESCVHAVQEAVERGYAEPDPTLDLSGGDVGRKLAILGALAGLWTTPPPTVVRPLLAPGAGSLEARLDLLNMDLVHRIERARDVGQRLRYIGRATTERIECALMAVDATSPLGRLRSDENGVVVYSERFEPVPLAVTGPGFGPTVTAQTLLADALAAARTLEPSAS